MSPETLLRVVAKRLPSSAAFSGKTAAWLHGLDVAPCSPIEVTIPFGGRRRAGLHVRRKALGRDEIAVRRGFQATSPIRTVADLAGKEPLTEGVVAADQFLHARLVTVAQLRTYVTDHAGAKGIARLRRIIDLAEPKTESPMETRLRMLLLLAGLSRPEVQAAVGEFRPDLLYREERLAIEYDGGNHRDRLVDDDRRQNALVLMGIRLLRFTAADVYGSPDLVVMRVKSALRAGIP